MGLFASQKEPSRRERIMNGDRDFIPGYDDDVFRRNERPADYYQDFKTGDPEIDNLKEEQITLPPNIY